ncbi:hypothetical protein D9615_006836 [Tricholomella constricta]|uniref:Uncharacterized protein n=1 Tax=Tricholomella constricta TaxID=117010 RepID=A0A8H5M2C5_9AGAR|nr:hypothetical protein D9615_006836 [Tricholomella constricta]
MTTSAAAAAIGAPPPPVPRPSRDTDTACCRGHGTGGGPKEDESAVYVIEKVISRRRAEDIVCSRATWTSTSTKELGPSDMHSTPWDRPPPARPSHLSPRPPLQQPMLTHMPNNHASSRRTSPSRSSATFSPPSFTFVHLLPVTTMPRTVGAGKRTRRRRDSGHAGNRDAEPGEVGQEQNYGEKEKEGSTLFEWGIEDGEDEVVEKGEKGKEGQWDQKRDEDPNIHGLHAI